MAKVIPLLKNGTWFPKPKSTSHAVLELVSQIVLHFAKALDTVAHHILLTQHKVLKIKKCNVQLII